MKLRRKTSSANPAYPSFEDYLEKRSALKHGLSLGTGALLVSGALMLSVGCDSQAEEKRSPAEADNPGQVIRLIDKPGRNGTTGKVNSAPVPKPMAPAEIAGGMPVPEPPALNPPVAIGGDIVISAPPSHPSRKPGESVKPEPPFVPGKITPAPPSEDSQKPTRPPTTDTPAVGGRILQPAPPQVDGKPREPVPPVTFEHPQIMGLMIAPEPPVTPPPVKEEK